MLFSVSFVFCVLWLGTKALFLACVAICAIVVAFICAICFYLPGISYFMQFNQLAIFILLGVGADDIFVFSEMWRIGSASIRPPIHQLSFKSPCESPLTNHPSPITPH